MKNIVSILIVFGVLVMSIASVRPGIARETSVRVVTIDEKTYLIPENCKPSVEECILEAKKDTGSNLGPHDYLGGA